MLLVECGFKFNTQDGTYGMHFIVSGGSFCWMPLPTVSSYIRANMLSQTDLCRWSKCSFAFSAAVLTFQWLFLEGHFGYLNLVWLN